VEAVACYVAIKFPSPPIGDLNIFQDVDAARLQDNIKEKVKRLQLMLGHMGSVINHCKCRANPLSHHPQLITITLVTSMHDQAVPLQIHTDIDAMQKGHGEVLAPELQAPSLINADFDQIALPIAKAVKVMGIKAVVAVVMELVTARGPCRFSKTWHGR
jgi:hypothetical protein